ncbi:MAG: PAS domain-containing protein [Desulfobacterales bacterium]|jgi:PAS domain S-box-containing protein
MRDRDKTKTQLICELEELRQKVPLESETGRAGGPVGLNINIAECKEAEDGHRQNEQEKIAILDSLMEHVIYHDRDMRIQWANKAACESARAKRKDLLGRYCYEVWAGRRRPCEDCPVIKVRETGQPQMVEKMTPDGRWWYIQGHPVRDSDGHVTGTTELGLDITKRRRAEEALHKAKNELEIRVAERTAQLVEGNERLRREIEVRKKAEMDLHETESLLSHTFKALQDLVVVIDKDLRVRLSNWKGYEFVSEKDRQAYPYCYEKFMNRKKPCNPCHAMEVFTHGEIKQLEHKNPIDGKIRDIRVLPIFDDEGKVVSVIEHLHDISDRKQAAEALRDSQGRLKSIFENAPIGFYRTTPDGRILDANPALIQMLGYACFEELSAVNLETDDYHPEYSRRAFRERIEREGKIKGMESFWRRPDGTLVYIRENARSIRDADGNIVYYEGTIEDVTDQRQAEEYIRSLSQQLIQAQESERQMISRELHDRVAQDLSTLLIGLDTLFDHQPNITAEVRKKALELSEILQGTIGAVRDLSYELRLPGLDNMGLIPALSMYCEEFAEKNGLKVELQSVGMSTFNLDFDTEMNLYRLIQEGLNNIRKHAAAGQAYIKLIGSHPNIVLRIEDDGKGFDIQQRARTASKDRRMGLRSMAERVSLMQGEMTIQSQPMKGTHIFIKFPHQEKKHGSKENHIDR